jgi:hypothetical protein
MLPADPESQMRGVVRFAQAVLDGWNELGTAIGSDRDEEQIVLELQAGSPSASCLALSRANVWLRVSEGS